MRRSSFIITCCLLAGWLPSSSGCLLLVDPPFITDADGSAAPATGWVDLSVSYSSVCALDADGAMWCGNGVGDLRLRDEGPFVSVSQNGLGSVCGVEAGGLLRCGISSGGETFELTELYTAVSGSSETGCGLQSFGAARCWPEANNVAGPFESVGAGDRFACGIQESSASLQCWSIDSLIFDEALDAPAGNFSRVVTDDSVGCALTTAGSITCWGYDFSGLVPAPAGNNYVDLSIQGNGCAVTGAGSIVCWGDDAGDPNASHLFAPDGITFTRVSVGHSLSCGIASDTGLHCW
jgi:hypothetical protein